MSGSAGAVFVGRNHDRQPARIYSGVWLGGNQRRNRQWHAEEKVSRLSARAIAEDLFTIELQFDKKVLQN